MRMRRYFGIRWLTIALIMLGVRELTIYRRAAGTLPPAQTVDTAGPVKSELERDRKSTKKKS